MIGWIDCQAGVSGDMLLGALVDAGVPVSVFTDAVAPLELGVGFSADIVTRGGLRGTKVTVTGTDSATERPASDVHALLERLELPLRDATQAVFRRLAEAEGQVHGIDPAEVHFHEVGALDAIADIVGVCAGFQHLGLERLVASTVSLGQGTTRGAHGPLPVPGPAVLALLTGMPVQAGLAPFESTTPTGAALLAELVTDWGALPAMTVDRAGVGAGDRDPAELANAVRLVIGTALDGTTTEVLLETNVDDLDPRLWPYVLQRLLNAGARDAWLTPILMKKGRPAHTLSVLAPTAVAAAVRGVVFSETTSLGLRETTVVKHALTRDTTSVAVDGQEIRVKHAWYDGQLVTSTPEWEDVATAAAALGRPARDVLREAQTSAKKPSAPSPPASGTPTQS